MSRRFLNHAAAAAGITEGQVETTVEGMTRFAARHAVFAWAFDMTAGPER